MAGTYLERYLDRSLKDNRVVVSPLVIEGILNLSRKHKLFQREKNHLASLFLVLATDGGQEGLFDACSKLDSKLTDNQIKRLLRVLRDDSKKIAGVEFKHSEGAEVRSLYDVIRENFNELKQRRKHQ